MRIPISVTLALVLLAACQRDLEPQDADGDGYASDVDCNDQRASIHPGADELCNGVDDDCDGEKDEDAVDAPTWYIDSDKDAFGYSGDPGVEACGYPDDISQTYVQDNTDCNDNDKLVNPGRTETCNGVDDDCDGLIDGDDPSWDQDSTADWYPDDDADGYGNPDEEPVTDCSAPIGGDWSIDPTDCNDTDPLVNPGAQEVCNGLDDDCDGLLDDDDDSLDQSTAVTWHADGDLDGYGDPAASGSPRCEDPSSEAFAFVANGEDCDDDDPAINPDGQEVCDALDKDEDCDGSADDDDASVDAGTMDYFWTDADSDGYGDPTGTPVLACDDPGGMTLDNSDCDDGESTVNPGEAEVCGDGLDNDCSGANECAPAGETAMSDLDITVGSTAGNGTLGYAAVLGDFDGDGAQDLVTADYVATNDSGDANAGETYVFYGIATGAYDVDADADATLQGDGSTWIAGRALVAGDVDGDGFDDLILGAPHASSGSTYPGKAFLIYGSSSAWSGTSTVATEADSSWAGASNTDYFAAALSLTGDVSGNGSDDLAIGAFKAGSGNPGAVYLLQGPLSATGDGDIDDLAHATFEGEGATEYLGHYRTLSDAIDFDGDGTKDLVMSAWAEDDFTTSGGAVYIWQGPISAGTYDVMDADTILTPTKTADYLGRSVASAGDIDGDGTTDLLVGASHYDGSAGTNSGAAFAFFGGSAWSGTTSEAAAVADLTVEGADNGIQLGITVATGDFDDDGASDLVLGAPKDSSAGSTYGAAFMLLGPTAGSYTSADADAWVVGEETGSDAGNFLGVGDADGDGVDDLITAALGSDQLGILLGAGL